MGLKRKYLWCERISVSTQPSKDNDKFIDQGPENLLCADCRNPFDNKIHKQSEIMPFLCMLCAKGKERGY